MAQREKKTFPTGFVLSGLIGLFCGSLPVFASYAHLAEQGKLTDDPIENLSNMSPEAFAWGGGLAVIITLALYFTYIAARAGTKRNPHGHDQDPNDLGRGG